MREIEFRIKCGDAWYYGLPLSKVGNNTVAFNSFDGNYYDLFADAKALGQYTGLKDKNGTKIFEGDIVEFERNSKKWLRFKIIHNDRTIEVEAPYVKQTKLRQSSIDGYSYRPVVKLNIKIGDFSTTAEFNLIDRTKMQYALLIGRNLLTDIAVVDVSRRYVQGRSDKTSLLIVCTDDYIEAVKNGINLNAEYDILQKLNKGGQIANKATDGAESLGTNAQVALPSVNNQIEQKEGKKPALKLDKKQQKKKAAEKALQEEEENEASSLKANPFLNQNNTKK